MSTKILKPLLVLGLRGTLLERIHVRQIPPEMPIPDLTVGMFKVWLRPNILTTLLELQKHCNLAIWSSTTARNTFPLVDAIFNNQMFLEEHQIIKPPQQIQSAKDANNSTKTLEEQQQEEEQQKEQQKAEGAENKAKSKTSRLTKRNTHDASSTAASSVKENSAEQTTGQGNSDNTKSTNNPSYVDSDGRFISPFKF